jgi:hypothetical protein
MLEILAILGYVIGAVALIRWITVVARTIIANRSLEVEPTAEETMTATLQKINLDTFELKQVPLSWPSDQVLREYKALPEASQVYGDIEETLRALDTKHDRNLLNSHFYLGPDEFHDGNGWTTWGGGNSWIGGLESVSVNPTTGEDRRHQHHGCIGSEHYALHIAIEEIRKAIKAKEKAIELAGVEHELGHVPTLLEALQREAEANRP